MAMGKPRQWPIDLAATEKIIKQYKRDADNGVIKHPSIAGFCGRCEASMAEYMDVIERPNANNMALSGALKKFGTWLDGAIIERSGGPNGSMAIFLLKQGFGGYKYTDRQDVKTDAKVEIDVKFGGNVKDPFG